MEPQLDDEITQFLRSINSTNQDGETDQNNTEEVVDVYFIPRQKIASESDIVDAAAPVPVQSTQGPSALVTVAVLFFCLSLPVSSIAFQLYFMLHPPVATVTIIPDTKTVTFTGTLPLGRLTHAITLYQAQTVPTTGRGHQDARAATGTLTFYNASFSAQVVSAGSVFVGSDGTQTQTDMTINVPANNPPQDGIASVSAHAVTPGSHGNIQALGINSATSDSLFVKNLDAFSGGQDARDFPIVTKRDIESAAAPLKTTLSSAMTGALAGELRIGEELLALPCGPSVESNHQPGDEASKVTVTVSQTCDGIAYSGQELHTRAAQLLTSKAATKLGAGYSRIGSLQVSIKGATITGATPTLRFSSVGTWVFGLTTQEQTHIKKAIAGKVPQEAIHILSSLPGVRSASLQWNSQAKLPTDARYIHLIFVIPA